MEEHLDSICVYYENQKLIKNVGYVDFFLPDFMLIIECDGDYWHNLPKQIDKDKRRDLMATLQGYETLRLWEHEINGDISMCAEKLSIAMRARQSFHGGTNEPLKRVT